MESAEEVKNTVHTSDRPEIKKESADFFVSPNQSLQRKVFNQMGVIHLKPYVCEECDEKFYKYKELMVHRNAHNRKLYHIDGTKASSSGSSSSSEDVGVTKGKDQNEEMSDLAFNELRKCENESESWNSDTNNYKSKESEDLESDRGEINLPSTSLYQNTVKERDMTSEEYKILKEEKDENSGLQTNDSAGDEEVQIKVAAMGGKMLYNAVMVGDHLECEICGDLFSSYEDFQMHELSQHIQIVYPNTDDRQEYQFEVKKKNAPKHIYQCNQCQKGFTTLSDLRRHASVHIDEKPYQCIKCDKSFRRRDNFKRHTSLDTCKALKECTKCKIIFVDMAELTQHMKEVHTSNDVFKCKICHQEFKKSSILKAHMKADHRDVVKEYKCEECGKCFNHVGNLKAHLRIHSGEKPFRCDQCGKCFSRQGNLTTHKRCHTGEKPCQCEVCGKRFKHISGLRYHLTTHSNEKPNICTECGKSFKCLNGLKYHIQVTHIAEKPYRCEQCGEGFTQACKLNIHLNIHNGGKVYQCEVCAKCFSRPHGLKAHMSAHSPEKNFKCEFCGKCFSRKGYLRAHLKVHGERSTFVNKDSLISFVKI